MRNCRLRHPRIVRVDLAKEADKLQPVRCTGQLWCNPPRTLDLVIMPAQLVTPNTALSGVAWRKARNLWAICQRHGLRLQVYTLGGLTICEAPKCYQILPYCLRSLLKYPPTYQRLGTKDPASTWLIAFCNNKLVHAWFGLDLTLLILGLGLQKFGRSQPSQLAGRWPWKLLDNGSERQCRM